MLSSLFSPLCSSASRVLVLLHYSILFVCLAGLSPCLCCTPQTFIPSDSRSAILRFSRSFSIPSTQPLTPITYLSRCPTTLLSRRCSSSPLHSQLWHSLSSPLPPRQCLSTLVETVMVPLALRTLAKPLVNRRAAPQAGRVLLACQAHAARQVLLKSCPMARRIF